MLKPTLLGGAHGRRHHIISVHLLGGPR
jgi:hypothetical protein